MKQEIEKTCKIFRTISKHADKMVPCGLWDSTFGCSQLGNLTRHLVASGWILCYHNKTAESRHEPAIIRVPGSFPCKIMMISFQVLQPQICQLIGQNLQWPPLQHKGSTLGKKFQTPSIYRVFFLTGTPQKVKVCKT